MATAAVASTLSGALCSEHVDVPAAAICARCGRFACTACLAQPALCRTCAPMLRPSALAVASAILGGLGICSVLPGLLAIVLAQVELGRIAAGKAPSTGADWARAGRTLGAVGLLLGTLAAWIVYG